MLRTRTVRSVVPAPRPCSANGCNVGIRSICRVWQSRVTTTFPVAFSQGPKKRYQNDRQRNELRTQGKANDHFYFQWLPTFTLDERYTARETKQEAWCSHLDKSCELRKTTNNFVSLKKNEYNGMTYDLKSTIKTYRCSSIENYKIDDDRKFQNGASYFREAFHDARYAIGKGTNCEFKT